MSDAGNFYCDLLGKEIEVWQTENTATARRQALNHRGIVRGTWAYGGYMTLLLERTGIGHLAGRNDPACVGDITIVRPDDSAGFFIRIVPAEIQAAAAPAAPDLPLVAHTFPMSSAQPSTKEPGWMPTARHGLVNVRSKATHKGDALDAIGRLLGMVMSGTWQFPNDKWIGETARFIQYFVDAMGLQWADQVTPVAPLQMVTPVPGVATAPDDVLAAQYALDTVMGEIIKMMRSTNDLRALSVLGKIGELIKRVHDDAGIPDNKEP